MDKKNKNFDKCLLSHIREGDTDEVKLVLKDVNPRELRDKSGKTLLHFAAEYGNEPVMQYLIKRGCQVNVTDKFGNTPLILAAKSEEISVMHVLLEAKAVNVLVANKRGKSAATVIVSDLKCHAISVLTALLGRVKEECDNDSVRTARTLLKLRCSLSQAVCLRDPLVTEYMLKSGCRVNESSIKDGHLTPLHQAVRSTDLDNVKLLLEYGADIEAAMFRPPARPVHLVRCHETGSTDILKVLLKKGCRITDDSGKLLIGEYFQYGNEETVDLLLQYAPDLDVKDHLGSPLLRYLAGNERFDPIEKLRGKHLDVGARDDRCGSTALMAVVFCNNMRTVEWLLEKGAQVSVANEEGDTAFVYAFNNTTFFAANRCLETRLKCIELLLQHGADAQWMSPNRRTLFDYVSRLKEFVLIKPVLAHIALTEALGGEVNELILEKIVSHSMFEKYFDFCKRTIERMKNTKIHRTMTMFDFLTGNEKKILSLVRNEKVVSPLKVMINSKRRSKLYYRKILRKRLANVDQIVNLRNVALNVVLKVRELRGNRIVAETIVDYLSYDDLLVIKLV